MGLVNEKGEKIKTAEEQPVLLMPDKTTVPLSEIKVLGITTRHRVLIQVPSAVPVQRVQALMVMAREFFSPAKVVVLQNSIEVTISEDPGEAVGDGTLPRN